MYVGIFKYTPEMVVLQVIPVEGALRIQFEADIGPFAEALFDYLRCPQ